MQIGIPLATSDAGKQCLGEILATLEKEKEPMSTFTTDEACVVCSKFAIQVFDNADKIDRSGNSNKTTAKSFYAAAVFLEILEQFDDPSKDEHKEKRLYAKWKATEILKAIKEGREIVPGGYGEQEQKESEEEVHDSVEVSLVGTNSETVLPEAPHSSPEITKEKPTIPESLPPPAYEESLNVTPVQPIPVAVPPPTSPPDSSPTKSSSIWGFGGMKKSPDGKASAAKIEDAKELTRFALAALEARDVNLAGNRLKEALKALGY